MAISVAQRNAGGDAASTSSVALAFGSNLTASSAVIAIGVTDSTASAISISHTQASSFNLVSTITSTSFVMKAWIAYGSTAAADTVTLSDSFSDANLFIFEVTGLAASSAFDQSKFQDQSSATALSSTATATLTNANNLVLGITANTKNPGLAPTVGAGYSNLQTLTTNFNGGGSEEKIVAATTAVSATFGLASNNGNEATAVFVFSDTIILTVPTVTTQAATAITGTTAVGNGNITATGGANADERGVVYATTTQTLPGNVAPASSGYAFVANETSGSFGTGAYTETLSNLQGNKTYFARAYAHNSAGYAYGSEVSFTTLKTVGFITNHLRPSPFKPGLAR